MRIKTEIPLSLAFVKGLFGHKSLDRDSNTYFSAICTDSRKIQGGELFIGLMGEKFDGSKFIPKIKNSVLLTIGSKSSSADITLENPNISLMILANAYKKLLSIKNTIAVTGSTGKTTTKNLLSMLLRSKFETHSTYKNLNNEIGVPSTVLMTPKNAEILLVEAGMNHLGELRDSSICIEPDISVITNIGTAHIGNLGSREKIADAKCEILCGMKKEFAIIPADEKLLKARIKSYKTVLYREYEHSHHLADKAFLTSDADYRFISTAEKDIYEFKAENNIYRLKIPELDKASFHIASCLSFALSVCDVLGMNENEINYALADIDFSLFSNEIQVNDLKIINDSYNSSPDALIGALNAFKKRNIRKSALLGDMLELGEFSEALHYKVGFHAAKSGLERLYLIGEFSNCISEGAVAGGFDKNKIYINHNADNPEATASQILTHSANEVILFKASRKIKLERIIDILKKAQK